MPSDPPVPDFAPENQFPELTRLAAAAKAADWSTVESIFSDLSDPDDRVCAAWMVADLDGADDMLKTQAATDTGTLGRTLYGIRLVLEGWRIRTGDRARNVTRTQFDGFHEYVGRAEALLIDATARDPHDLTAWTERVVTARALEFGQSEARRRYDRVSRRAPHMYTAQSQLLQKLCPKWGGSFQAAEAFVRECVAAAPPGSPVPVLVVDYHFEHRLDVSLKDFKRYLSRPEVRADIMSAAERTVDSPDFRPGLLRYRAHNFFAAAFSLMDEHRAAARQFEAIGSCATDHPWAFLGGRASTFAAHRATALAKG